MVVQAVRQNSRGLERNHPAPKKGKEAQRRLARKVAEEMEGNQKESQERGNHCQEVVLQGHVK